MGLLAEMSVFPLSYLVFDQSGLDLRIRRESAVKASWTQSD